jgi:osmotically-inducible protein OsmY
MKFSCAPAFALIAGLGVSSAALAAGSVNLNQPAVGPDKTITRMVQQDINMSLSPNDKVSVATTHNVVWLHGFVSSDADRQKAEDIASHTMGVAGVENYLVIGSAANE